MNEDLTAEDSDSELQLSQDDDDVSDDVIVDVNDDDEETELIHDDSPEGDTKSTQRKKKQRRRRAAKPPQHITDVTITTPADLPEQVSQRGRGQGQGRGTQKLSMWNEAASAVQGQNPWEVPGEGRSHPKTEPSSYLTINFVYSVAHERSEYVKK